jgi:hypothetical protein
MILANSKNRSLNQKIYHFRKIYGRHLLNIEDDHYRMRKPVITDFLDRLKGQTPGTLILVRHGNQL